MKRLFALIIVLATLFQVPLLAQAEKIYSFEHPSQQARFNHLTHQMRCLVCQNQNIAESDAGLAADLRQHIYEQISAKKSNEEITDYLKDRYGDFVSFKPPFQANTYALWLAPFILLLMGLAIISQFYRQRRAS